MLSTFLAGLAGAAIGLLLGIVGVFYGCVLYDKMTYLMNLPLILLGALGVWWLLLTWFVVRSYRQRMEEAKIPLTPEQVEECKRLKADLPRKPPLRRRDYVIVGPLLGLVAFITLPFWLYGWFLKHRDPYDRQTKA
jgi:hypothetical protein